MTPAEAARKYQLRYKILQRDPVLRLNILDDDKVELLQVDDIDQTGQLTIPWFVTDLAVKTESLMKYCKFTRIVVEGRPSHKLKLNHLCKDMLSDRIELEFKNPSNVEQINGMFKGCTQLKEIKFIGSSGLPEKLDTDRMFFCCEKLERIEFEKDTLLKPLYTSEMFYMCKKLKEVDSIMEHISLENCVQTSKMFMSCQQLMHIQLDKLNISNVADTDRMFAYCVSLETLVENNDSKIYLDNLKKAESMFYMCFKLKDTYLKNMVMPKIISMASMYQSCKSIKRVDMQGVNYQSLWTMRDAFRSCENIICADFSGANLELLEDMGRAFEDCTRLRTIEFTGANLEHLTNMMQTFKDCAQLKSIDMSNINTPNLKEIQFICHNTGQLESFKLQGSAKQIAFAWRAFSRQEVQYIEMPGLDIRVQDTAEMLDEASGIKQVKFLNGEASDTTFNRIGLAGKTVEGLKLGS